VRLLLHENASDRSFVARLRAGHDVETSVAALGVGASDRAILAHAQATFRVVVTPDCADFRVLVADERSHPVLLIYAGDVHPAATLVRAIDNIAATFPGGDVPGRRRFRTFARRLRKVNRAIVSW